jgi:hypothetical protein
MNSSDHHLVVLNYSSSKSHVIGGLPVADRYDGSMYGVLRLFLHKSIWLSPLSVAILSVRGHITNILHADGKSKLFFR